MGAERMSIRRYAALVASLLIITACTSPGTPTPERGRALFYAKGGAIYVSQPAGSPGRKLTDGPADTEPAPSPDGKRVAYVHRAGRDDYGGELWVLDLPAGGAPVGAPRRLVDPADLEPKFGEEPGRVVTPRWSPTGDRIAFLKTGEGGGFLLVADPATGTVTAPAKPMFADNDYAWARDGAHIAWAGGRSDVSPVTVSVLTVGGASVPVAKDTNAYSVSYLDDGAGGQSVLFTNGDATGSLFASIPFALRDGGVYSVQPPSAPRPLVTGRGFYSDVAGLPSRAVGFTEAGPDDRIKSIKVLDRDSRSPRTIAETPGDAPGPQWTDDTVAYVGTGDERPLLVKQGNSDARRIDTGVDAFAWGAAD